MGPLSDTRKSLFSFAFTHRAACFGLVASAKKLWWYCGDMTELGNSRYNSNSYLLFGRILRGKKIYCVAYGSGEILFLLCLSPELLYNSNDSDRPSSTLLFTVGYFLGWGVSMLSKMRKTMCDAAVQVHTANENKEVQCGRTDSTGHFQSNLQINCSLF